jgi:glycosyltransferase involved in cell wall biosynthesis
VFLTTHYFNDRIVEGHKILSNRIINAILMSTDWNVYVFSLEKPTKTKQSILYYQEITPGLQDWFASAVKIIRFLNSTNTKIIHILAYNKVFPILLDKTAHINQRSHRIIAHLYYHPEAFKNLGYKPIELFLKLGSFNMILTTSHTLKNFLVKKLRVSENRVRAIPPIIPQGFFEFDYQSSRKLTPELRKFYRVAESDFVISYIGHIIPQRGIFELLRAFKEASKFNQHLKLIVSYPNIVFKDLSLDYLTILKRMIEKYELTEKVLIIGKEDLNKLYTISDLLFFGFRDAFYFTYPPLVVCEAMAAGMPFIMKKSSLVMELFGEIAPVPVYQHANELSTTLSEIANNQQILLEISKKIRDVAKKTFSPESMIKNLIDTYLSMLSYE